MLRGTNILLYAALIAGAVWISGCAGETDHYHQRSTTKLLEIYLKAATPEGQPLEGATVWVDGSAQSKRTGDAYRRLDSMFPPDWRGWEYNWSGGPFRFDARDFPRHGVQIEILVSKSGWETQRSTIPISPDAPDDLFMRQTFVMERRVGTAEVGVMAETVVDATDPAEIISLSKPAWQWTGSVDEGAE